MRLTGERFCFRSPVCVIVAPQAVKIEAVSKLSAARKLGVVARVATQQAGRNPTVRAASRAAATTGRVFGRVLHQLWLEVTGVVFLIMSLSFAGASVKEFEKYHAGQIGAGRFAATAGFAVAFAWFGVSSFWRVKKKDKGRAR
jgi:hypothetical protein